MSGAKENPSITDASHELALSLRGPALCLGSEENRIMTTPAELAALPATEGHIERAKAAVRAYPAKQKYLDALLASNPTRGQMVEFTESVRIEAIAYQLDLHIKAICKAAGIENPTGAERLTAMQIGCCRTKIRFCKAGCPAPLTRCATMQSPSRTVTLPRSLAA